MKWETTAGIPTRGDTYAQIMEKLRELEELTSMMAHLHNTEDNPMDKLLAKGWLGIGELFHKVRDQVTKLAIGRLQ